MSERYLSEMLAVVGAIDPDAYTTGTQLTDAIDMQMHREVIFAIQVGTFGTAATVDFEVMESATSGGTYTQLDKDITQLTDGDDDKQVIVNVRASELTAGMRYLKGSLRLLVEAVDSGVIAFADRTRYSDAVTSTSYGDLASVDEIVA